MEAYLHGVFTREADDVAVALVQTRASASPTSRRTSGGWKMPAASQQHIDGATPMGATLVDGGATFRVWAPRARSVHVAFGGVEGYAPTPDDALVENPDSHHWTGFFPGVVDGTMYPDFRRMWAHGGGGFRV
jgi:hypothetical protein